jgi:hypothetical protein
MQLLSVWNLWRRETRQKRKKNTLRFSHKQVLLTAGAPWEKGIPKRHVKLRSSATSWAATMEKWLGEVQWFVLFYCREATASSIPYLKLTSGSNLPATVCLHNTQQAINVVSFICVSKTNFIANANAKFYNNTR